MWILYLLEASLIAIGLGLWLEAPWYAAAAMTLIAYHLVTMGAAAMRFCTVYAAAIRVAEGLKKDGKK